MREIRFLALIATLGVLETISGQNLPTVYEYFTEGGIEKGLEAKNNEFFLNGKAITIHSGAIHYFRIHPQYWRDRLRKLRAAGFIAVETYVPWNLHEPDMDVYDFGDGNRDFSQFLDIRKFIQTAQEEDLLVILRPGPYICAEWVMGGLPSWLLRFPGIKMRTSEPQYTERVKKYYDKLLPYVDDLQFTKKGAIIAVQLENEFSSVSYPSGPDDQHLKDLKTIVEDNGIVELLFTSDNTLLPKGTIPGVMRTVNFQKDPLVNLGLLKLGQPNLPAMVMEYWTGWYDHWFAEESGRNNFSPEDFGKNLETSMKFPASVNLYMFIGGTNWGFLNGGNAVINKETSQFDVTSYDYGAPLTEAGDYTEKYYIAQNLSAKYQPIKFKISEQPPETKKIAYNEVQITSFMDLATVFENAGEEFLEHSVINMEMLPANNGSGQSYGYVWYRKNDLTIKSGDILKITGHVHDAVQVFVDGKLQTKVLETLDDIQDFGFWKVKDGELTLKDSGSTLDIIVENLGRINFGLKAYDDRKGLFDGPVSVNDIDLFDWTIKTLEFKTKWAQSLSENSWKPISEGEIGSVATGLYRGFVEVASDSEPADTFILTEGWTKGIIIVNGFNLGRYNKLGPQMALYLPGPLLKPGRNEIILYEQYIPASTVKFSEQPRLG